MNVVQVTKRIRRIQPNLEIKSYMNIYNVNAAYLMMPSDYY